MANGPTGGIISALRRGFTAVRGAVSRGLDTLGISSLLIDTGVVSRERDAPGLGQEEFSLRLARRLEFVASRIRPANRHEQGYSILAPSAHPSSDLVREAVTRMQRQFAWVVEVDVETRDTGELEIRTVTISSSTLLSKFEILAKAEPLVRASPVRVLRSRIIEGIQAGELGSIL